MLDTLEEIYDSKFSEEEMDLLNRYVEAVTAKAAPNRKSAIKSLAGKILPAVATNVKSLPDKIRMVIQKYDQNGILCSERVKDWMQTMEASVEGTKIILEKAANCGVRIAEKKSLTIQKIKTGVQDILKWYQETVKARNEVKKTLAVQHNQQYANVNFGESNQPQKDGYWIQCDNPLYGTNLLTEGNGQVKKIAKATLLMVVTVIVVTILTNALRTFFGGTIGGGFSSRANQVAFLFFSRVVLTPFIEEPAKLISIRGGYGKQFFLAFNMVEFGLYTIMMLGAGVNLTPIILFRSLAVMMHALTTKLQSNNTGTAFSKAWRLAISIVLHFIFNAVFLKYMLSGIGSTSNALLLFAIGFFGIAFGLFAMVKKKSDNEFTTVGNTEQG